MESWLILLRGTSLAAILSAFGCSVFGLAFGTHHKWLRLGTVGLALILTIGWLFLASAEIAGAETIHDLIAALPIVAFDTRFGRLGLARLVCLLFALLPGRFGRALGVVATAIAGVLQAGMGHAAAAGGEDGLALIGMESLHLLAAGAWLSGLLPLLVALAADPPGAAQLCRAFSPLGFASVLVLSGTGVFQAEALVEHSSALIGTPYGRMVLVKLALFTVLLALAVVNRFTLTVGLPESRRWLLGSVAIETGFGLAIIVAAARLASLAPIRGL
jgi:putative copper resistance protein D